MEPLDQAVKDRVVQRMKGTSIREQFQSYAQTHHPGDADIASFRTIKDIRDDAVHGDL